MKNTLISLLIFISLLVTGMGCSDDASKILYDSAKDKTGSPWAGNGGGSVPTRLEMEQNYPNPFNPSTKMLIAVPEHMNITMRVYSENWEEVATLIDRDLEAGYYMIEFDAGGLASGVYYYMVEGGAERLIRAMRLAK